MSRVWIVHAFFSAVEKGYAAPKKPFVVRKRRESKTFLLTLNTASGLSVRICREWNRKSFQNFPAELVIHSNPKTKTAAETGALALIAFPKGSGAAVKKEDTPVGEWLRLFCSITESPKGAHSVTENRTYSNQSADRLKTFYKNPHEER
jgi:hypothetical protein